MTRGQYIRELLREDALEEAIRELGLLEAGPESKSVLVLLSAAYARIRLNTVRGLLTREDADVAKNNLIAQILSALERIEGENARAGRPDSREVQQPNTENKRESNAGNRNFHGGGMGHKRRKVFVSYSSNDRSFADAVNDALTKENFDVWIDSDSIKPGDHIASAITEGLNDADYFVLLISENSSRSDWVKREIATAFELSNTKKLSVVPVLIAKTELPLEFRGLLYIDASRSLEEGLRKLVDFFRSQLATVADLEKQVGVRKSNDEITSRWRECQDQLRELSLSDLRYELSNKLTLTDVKVLWFDVFHARMEDEVQVQNVSLCCVELLDRSRREKLLVELINRICRNHPRLSIR